MSELTTIAKRISQIKGEMSYSKLAAAILEKTGKKLSPNCLQTLGAGTRKGRLKTLAILSEYTEKPLTWFFTEDDFMANNVDINALFNVLITAFERDINKASREITLEDIRILLELAREIVNLRKSKQI